MAAASPSALRVPTFLRIPPTIRDLIYDYYLTSQVADRCIMVYSYNPRAELVNLELDLLYVCKQIYTEASRRFFDANIFCFEFLPQFDIFLAPRANSGEEIHSISALRPAIDRMSKCRIAFQPVDYQSSQVISSFEYICAAFLEARKLKRLTIEIRSHGDETSRVGVKLYRRLLAPFQQLRGLAMVSIQSESLKREEVEALEVLMTQGIRH